VRIGLSVAVVAFSVLLSIYFVFRHHPVAFPGDHPIAPQFSLTDLNGRNVALSSYRGKVVLLDFWATWCDPCREEIPRFIQLQDDLGKKGLQIIGISMDDDVQPVREFYRQYRINYPVAMGDAKLGDQYGGILGVPIAFVIGRDGRIYAKHVGATRFSVFEDEVSALLERTTTVASAKSK
jgi:peroxiredoxin